MKKILTTTILVLGSFVLLQATPHLSISEAVKRASSQERLTQSIAKSYLCVVSEIDKEQHKKKIQASLDLFDTQLEELKNLFFNHSIREQVNIVEAQWKYYRFVCQGKYNKNNALLLLELNTEMRVSCNRMVVLLRQHAYDNKIDAQELFFLNTVICLERKQMLMQRMLLYILAQRCNLGSQDANQNYYTIAAEHFLETHEKLSSYSITEAYSDWVAFEEDLSTLSTNMEETALIKLHTLVKKVDADTFSSEELISQKE